MLIVEMVFWTEKKHTALLFHVNEKNTQCVELQVIKKKGEKRIHLKKNGNQVSFDLTN